jgi:hypothetical protein
MHLQFRESPQKLSPSHCLGRLKNGCEEKVGKEGEDRQEGRQEEISSSITD